MKLPLVIENQRIGYRILSASGICATSECGRIFGLQEGLSFVSAVFSFTLFPDIIAKCSTERLILIKIFPFFSLSSFESFCFQDSFFLFLFFVCEETSEAFIFPAKSQLAHGILSAIWLVGNDYWDKSVSFHIREHDLEQNNRIPLITDVMNCQDWRFKCILIPSALSYFH